MTVPHVTRWCTAAAATVVLPLILSACANTAATGLDTGESSGGAFESNVDVDTAQLRALKEKSGVETCEPGSGGSSIRDGGLPRIELPCLGGGPQVDLSTLRGPLVINLWAQWCGPCREELPYYERLHAEAGDGSGDGSGDQVEVIGVDYQDTRPDAALELAGESGVTYPLLADPGAELRVPFKVRGLPAAVFVDRDGTVTHTEYVVIRSYGQLRDLVEEHLDVTLAGAR